MMSITTNDSTGLLLCNNNNTSNTNNSNSNNKHNISETSNSYPHQISSLRSSPSLSLTQPKLSKPRPSPKSLPQVPAHKSSALSSSQRKQLHQQASSSSSSTSLTSLSSSQYNTSSQQQLHHQQADNNKSIDKSCVTEQLLLALELDPWIQAPEIPENISTSNLSNELVYETLRYFINCSYRVSQMVKTSEDIDAVIKLLQEKQIDLELAARIGQDLLRRNNKLKSSIQNLQQELEREKEDNQQLKYNLACKNSLLKTFNEEEEQKALDIDSSEELKKRLLNQNHDLIKSIKTLEDELEKKEDYLQTLEQKTKWLENDLTQLRVELASKTSLLDTYIEHEQDFNIHDHHNQQSYYNDSCLSLDSGNNSNTDFELLNYDIPYTKSKSALASTTTNILPDTTAIERAPPSPSPIFTSTPARHCQEAAEMPNSRPVIKSPAQPPPGNTLAASQGLLWVLDILRT